jgi:FkbM family methyltransferase
VTRRPARTARSVQAAIRRDVVFDVGLHRGEDTAYYLALGYTVVAFEANPDLVAECRHRFEAALDEGRLTIVEGAVASTSSPTVTFFRHPTESVWGTTKPEWAERNARTGESLLLEVPVVDFPDAIRRHGVPTYMKVDIEGEDRTCLGALEHLAERPNFVSIESEKRDWEALLEELDFLAGLGYERFAAVQQETIPGRTVTCRTLGGELLTHTFESGASGPFGDEISGWCSKDEVIRRYRAIFRRYRAFGDHAPLGRTRGGRVIRQQARRMVRRPLPGWYDTHARLCA